MLKLKRSGKFTFFDVTNYDTTSNYKIKNEILPEKINSGSRKTQKTILML